MRDHELLARLAACNPVPVEATVLARPTVRPRRWPIAIALAAAIGVPTAAFAHRLGEVLGLTNQGTPVATDQLRESQDTKLAQAMRELQFPGQIRLLGERDGVTFYATRNAAGAFCFAIDGGGPEVTPSTPRGVGCAPAGFFPSQGRPILGFPMVARSPYVQFLAGFAVDDVARVDLVDANGRTVVSAPVSDNLYAATDIPQVPATAIVAYDANGNVVYRKELRG